MWFCIEVRFLHGRYHGRGRWPPTPLRLFQAVTAGALAGRWAVEDRPAAEAALRWLERLGAPAKVIGPAGKLLRPYRLAVPNNQADRHVAALRKGERLDDLLRQDKELKHVVPIVLGRQPLIYAWEIADKDEAEARAVQAIVRRLTVLGTGLDHAVADARLCRQMPTAIDVVEHHIGEAACGGTLDSLTARYRAGLERLAEGGLRENLPPISFEAAHARPRSDLVVFSLRMPAEDRVLAVAPELTAVLAYAIRKALADVLHEAISRSVATSLSPPLSGEDVDRLVLGRGAGPGDKERRIIVLPLPSIGHPHADGLLRRALLVLPAKCPLNREIAQRALNDAEVVVERSDATTPLRLRLALLSADTMGQRYVANGRIWRTVSPVVLPGTNLMPGTAADPVAYAARQANRSLREAALLRRAVIDAGIDPAAVVELRLRRDPFDAHQPRADARWHLPRNPEGQRWLAGKPRLHAEIAFATERPGPLAIGDGRYLGLGLMRPMDNSSPDWLNPAGYAS